MNDFDQHCFIIDFEHKQKIDSVLLLTLITICKLTRCFIDDFEQPSVN